MVQTKYGLMPRDVLEVRDIVQENGNSRSIVTEWCYVGEPKDLLIEGQFIKLEKGEVVRRDGHVAILKTQAIGGEQAKI